MDFQAHRPPGYVGLGDSSLPRLINELKQVLVEAQAELVYDTLSLPDHELARLAHVLVEFAEDLYNDIGIWTSLEGYNRDFFATPLPLILPADQPPDQTPSLEDRLRHLLWVLYAEIEPDLIMAPGHQDLRHLAAISADFLADRFAGVPRRSGVKQFLGQRDKFG